MQKARLLFGAFALMALGLSSCSTDMPDGGDNTQFAQKDETRYVRVAIANPPSTRAEGDDEGDEENKKFLGGTGDENAVNNIYLKFYDITGAPIENGQVTLSKEGWTNVTAGEGEAVPNVGRIKEAVVGISLEKGQAMPAYVMCFINPVSYNDGNGVGSNMADLRSELRSDFMGLGGGFAMSNSVYYGKDVVSGAANVKISGTPILSSQLYTTEAAALAAEAAVDIYVERYASKVNFSLAANAVKPVTVDGYTLTFVPERWSINADAPNMYVVKRFADSNSENTGIPTFDQVDATLGGWDTWNDETNHRSYWASSPSFYATKFPRVSDDIIDLGVTDANVPGSNFGAGIAVAPYALRYYSYNQITNPTLKSKGLGVEVATAGGSNSKYVLENTMGPDAFRSANPMAATASVVLVGKYTLSAGTTTLSTPDGFCVYGGKIYFKNAVPTGAPTGAMTILDALLKENGVLAVATTNGETTNYSTDLSAITASQKGCFVVEHPKAGVRGNVAVPHRYVTLQLSSNITAAQADGIYYKPNGSDEWRSLSAALSRTDLTADDKKALIEGINQTLWTQIGKADAYTSNCGYFSVPIRHLGYYESTDGAPETDDQLDWAKVKVGDFGLVRNHVYTINVSEINGLADGIDGLDNPLVPAMTSNNYYVKYKINILNWRIVPTQSGVLGK